MNCERRVEGQVRRLLVSFPWRDRLERGDEITATTLDTIRAEATRVPLGTAADLVRGGLTVRWQKGPPPGTRIAYGFAWPIHPRWLPWVFDNLEDPNYVRRQRRWVVVAMAVLYVVLLAFRLPDRGVLAAHVTSLINVLPMTVGLVRPLIEFHRARLRRGHGLVPGGVDVSSTWVRYRRGARLPNLRLAPLALWIALPLAGGSLAWVWAAANQQPILDPTMGMIEPAPANMLALCVPRFIAGCVVAFVAFGPCLFMVLRSDRDGADAPARSTPAGVVVTSVALTVLSGYVAVLIYVSWGAWELATDAAFVAPLAMALFGVGVAAMVVSRRSGVPLGLWDVVPFVGPHTITRPVPHDLALRYPPEDRWVYDWSGPRSDGPSPA